MIGALRHRNYRLFIGGQFVSLIGTWMQSVAQAWLIYRLSQSPLLLGAVSFCGQIPVLLLASFGGAAADRYSRRRIIVTANVSAMVLAFVLAWLVSTQRIAVWHVMVLAAILGVGSAFEIPARQAFVIEMVGRDDLPSAIALNSSVVNGARIVGPAVAGVLLANVGEAWCFLLNGLSYLAVLAGLWTMQLPPRARRPRTTSPLADIREGFAFVFAHPPIAAILLLVGLVSLSSVHGVLMPIFADQILHGGPRVLGSLTGASGLGALTGAVLLGSRRGLRGLGRWLVVATLGFGLGLIAFSSSRNTWLSALLLYPVGGCLMVQMAASNTLLQSMVPEELRGRVMALYSMMFLGVAPLGALLAGTAARSIGAPWTVTLGGLASVSAGIVFGRKLGELREGARRLIVAQATLAAAPTDATTTAPIAEAVQVLDAAKEAPTERAT